MSEEFKIPPDLALFESQLRAVTNSASKLNRDQLLYEAGWAAALAQHPAVLETSVRNENTGIGFVKKLGLAGRDRRVGNLGDGVGVAAVSI